MKELSEMSIDELKETIEICQKLLAEKTPQKCEIHLYANRFKGTGRCWVAIVDEHKKILRFVEAHSTIWQGKYKYKKIYFLPDGDYLICEVGTKTCDYRKYISVRQGQIVEKEEEK